MGIRPRAQSSMTYAHRLVRGQPAMRCVALGVSPGRMIRVLCTVGSGTGMEEIRALVYGCCGRVKIWSVGPTSITRPRYMTIVLLHRYRTVERSCVMKR